MFKTYEINVDLISDTAVPSSAIRFSTNDRNAAKLLLTITNKGAEIDLSQAKSVRISFKKPDGTRVFQNDCQPINALKGKYQIVLKTQTLAAEGYVYAQIHIEEADRVIDTQTFFFVVNESLASDQAIESINELSIIQKALEVGEKFKDVDFDPIIKAGELAANALPKTGGTVTGDIIVSGANKVIAVRNGTNQVGQAIDNNGEYYWYSTTNLKTPLKYNIATDTLTFHAANTNVYKKTDLYPNYTQPNGNANQLTNGTDLNNILETGDYAGGSLLNTPNGLTEWCYIEVIRSSTNMTMQRLYTMANYGEYVRRRYNGVWGGWVQVANSRGASFLSGLTIESGDLAFTNANSETVFRNNASGVFAFYDKKNDVVAWTYNPTTKEFNVSATTNLVKKTGDTMTGNLVMVNDRGVYYRSKEDVTLVAHRVDVNNRFVLRDVPGGKDIYSFEGGNLMIHANLKTTKDGRATLTPSADAELIGANGIIADRRGNTVTVRVPIRRKVGSTSSTVTTLPADMRPTMTLPINAFSQDGAFGLFTINTDGSINVSNSLIGKDLNMVVTYVVD